MILCSWRGNWYLSTGINSRKGLVALRSGMLMPRPEHFKPLPPAGVVYYGAVEDIRTVTFYPEIYYRGCRVYPWNGWHRESREPILSCLIGDLRASPDEPLEAVRARRERLLDEGWEDGGRDGVAGYVHVDDLEKVEGPPPDGPF